MALTYNPPSKESVLNAVVALNNQIIFTKDMQFNIKQYLMQLSIIDNIRSKLNDLPKSQPIFKDIDFLLDIFPYELFVDITRFLPALKESDLPEEIRKDIRLWVVHIYNYLFSMNLLYILSRPISEGEQFKVCQELKDIVSTFMNGMDIYEEILNMVKLIECQDLALLKRRYLSFELFNCETSLYYDSERLYNQYCYFCRATILRDIPSDNFKRGDFSFIPDKLSRESISNVFNIIELYGWDDVEHYRDLISRANTHQIILSFMMEQIYNIKKLGWSEYVKQYRDRVLQVMDN